MFIFFNPNPYKRSVDDCVIRAISRVTEQTWAKVYWDLASVGFMHGNYANGNEVWSAYLMSLGFKRGTIPNTCPACYTVRDFCEDNPEGVYLLATGSHVVAVVNGDYFDTWDSGDAVPEYYWTKGENDDANISSKSTDVLS